MMFLSFTNDNNIKISLSLLLAQLGQASTPGGFQATEKQYDLSSTADPVLADVLRGSERKMRESMAQAERKEWELQWKNLAAAGVGPNKKRRGREHFFGRRNARWQGGAVAGKSDEPAEFPEISQGECPDPRS
jgi:hypothetical protein